MKRFMLFVGILVAVILLLAIGGFTYLTNGHPVENARLLTQGKVTAETYYRITGDDKTNDCSGYTGYVVSINNGELILNIKGQKKILKMPQKSKVTIYNHDPGFNIKDLNRNLQLVKPGVFIAVTMGADIDPGLYATTTPEEIEKMKKSSVEYVQGITIINEVATK